MTYNIAKPYIFSQIYVEISPLISENKVVIGCQTVATYAHARSSRVSQNWSNDTLVSNKNSSETLEILRAAFGRSLVFESHKKFKGREDLKDDGMSRTTTSNLIGA